MNRRTDIDWLRVFATFVLFPFHVGKVFNVPPYYPLKNAELSDGMGNLTGFIHLWHMPLFFLPAGWSAHATLARRDAGAFAGERVRRLFVPFLFGMLVLCPFIVWAGLTAQPGFHEPFLTFLPTFYSRLDRFSWSHLWFLIYLFVFSFVWLPLLLALRGRSHQLAIVSLAAVVIRHPWSIASKFWLLLAASVVTTLACYQLVVRPVPLLPRLFGLAPKPAAGREKIAALERA